MTFSIVARDKRTGQMGVAVQSHWFSVGSMVPWARPGIGAVATQATAEASYGPLGLGLMAAGKSAEDALKADEMFRTLMGEKVEERRNFINRYALDVKDIDYHGA